MGYKFKCLHNKMGDINVKIAIMWLSLMMLMSKSEFLCRSKCFKEFNRFCMEDVFPYKTFKFSKDSNCHEDPLLNASGLRFGFFANNYFEH